jgi:YonK protein
MAKLNHTLTFKNAEISLENNEITEELKESFETHVLSDVLNRFIGKKVDITIKEVTDVKASSIEEN